MYQYRRFHTISYPFLAFCFDTSYHSLDTAVSLGKAYRHGSTKSAGHVIVLFKAETWDAKPFLPMFELNGVKGNKANAERLASVGETFVSVNDRRCINFFE
jgi:hypothetical protein